MLFRQCLAGSLFERFLHDPLPEVPNRLINGLPIFWICHRNLLLRKVAFYLRKRSPASKPGFATLLLGRTLVAAGTYKPFQYVKSRSRVVLAKSESASKHALPAQSANGHTRLRRQTSARFHDSYPWSGSFPFIGPRGPIAPSSAGPAKRRKGIASGD